MAGRKNGKMILLIFVLIFSGVHQQIKYILMQIAGRSTEGQTRIVMEWKQDFQCNRKPLRDSFDPVERVRGDDEQLAGFS